MTADTTTKGLAERVQAMLLNGLQDGTVSDRVAYWVAECALRAYEDGASDGIVNEIETLERERGEVT